MFLSVLLLLISGTEAAYYGSVRTSTTKDLVNDRFSVTYRRTFSFSSCEEVDSSKYCYSRCIKIEESRGTWCQKQRTWSRSCGSIISSNYAGTSPQWTTNRNGITSWRAWYYFDERNRSDINKPNSSPQTTIIPVLRVPSNCQRDINLLTVDPDGDEVKCRYASYSSDECDHCTPPSVLSRYSSCNVSFSPTSSSAEGSYAVQLQMQDFPREEIIMTDYSGAQSNKSTTSYLSTVPVQFVFTVDPAAPSCTEGEYLPKFMPPTPEHGAQFFIDVNQTLEITIKAKATQALTTELLFSGPVGVIKNSSGSGYFTMRWTPSEDHNKESHPICFVVQANVSSSVYQSELRCVIVTVGIKLASTPTPAPPHVTVLKMKISTTMALEDNCDKVTEAIKKELIRRGLPPDINVRLKVSKKTPSSG